MGFPLLLIVIFFNQALIPLLNAKLPNISSDEARENIRCTYKTQQDIADLLDVHQTTVSRFLSGNNSPKLVRNFNKYLNDSGLELILIGIPKNEWLKTLLGARVLIPEEEAVAVADERAFHPALTPRRTTVAVADQRSLQYVKDMYPHFIGWHGTSRQDLSLIHDNGIIIPDAGRYNLRHYPWLQYGPGFYVTESEQTAVVFAQKRVGNIHPETEDHQLPIIVPVFWNSQILPEIYKAGEDLELTTLKKRANRPTANGAVNRAINGKIDNLPPPDIVSGFIKDYETSTQSMLTRKGVGNIQIGIAYPAESIPQTMPDSRIQKATFSKRNV